MVSRVDMQMAIYYIIIGIMRITKSTLNSIHVDIWNSSRIDVLSCDLWPKEIQECDLLVSYREKWTRSTNVTYNKHCALSVNVRQENYAAYITGNIHWGRLIIVCFKFADTRNDYNQETQRINGFVIFKPTDNYKMFRNIIRIAVDNYWKFKWVIKRYDVYVCCVCMLLNRK